MSSGVKNIVLVGFMGTGKTSVGKVLARKLSRPLVDVDAWIEERERKKIREIFEKDGEARFRALENEAIHAVAQKTNHVITTGGGAVTDPENMRALKESGWVVCLTALPETIYERVKDSPHRPLLRSGDVLGEIRKLLEVRRPFYEASDFNFHTDGMTASQVADALIEMLRKNESHG